MEPAQVAFLTACAQGVVPGPLYLHTEDAARSNMLPPHLAAPGLRGDQALGAVTGTVAVSVAGAGVVPSSGVVQQAAVGAWSQTVPVRTGVEHALSAWASGAGAAIGWQTVNAAGAQVASGTVSAVAVTGGFRGSVSITPTGTAVGLQVRTVAGSLTVGGIRLVEATPLGALDWMPGAGGARVAVSDPAQTLLLVGDKTVRSDYTVTLREVG